MRYVEGKRFFCPHGICPLQMLYSNFWRRRETRKGGAYNRSTMCVGLARVGREDQLVIAGAMGSWQPLTLVVRYIH